VNGRNGHANGHHSHTTNGNGHPTSNGEANGDRLVVNSPTLPPPRSGQNQPFPPRQFGEVVLRLTNISKSFKVPGTDEMVQALRSINLCEDEGCFAPIRKGEFVMIRGPSGGGKTTLLNVIGTLDSPSTGSVELLGKPIDKNSSDDYLSDLRLKHIGFVFQTFNLIATMSAIENVELPMTLLGTMDEKARRTRAKQLLALVGLRNRVNHLPSELSGGEQQRVTIARALANSPNFLLLDEPTGDLDTQTTIEIMDLLMHINRMAQMTCLMVTHNPDVECYADRILYVSDGSFVEEVENQEPFSLNYDEYQKYLHKRDTDPTALLRIHS
jgi:putative ABC transport system ATP-binding protein